MGELDQILKIRSNRLDRLRREETKLREAFLAAQNEVDRVNALIEEFRGLMVQLEFDILNKMLEKEANTNELETFFQKLKTAEEDAKKLEEKLSGAENDLLEAEKKVDAVWKQRISAQSKKQKLTELTSLYDKRQKILGAKKESKAFDEIVETLRKREM